MGPALFAVSVGRGGSRCREQCSLRWGAMLIEVGNVANFFGGGGGGGAGKWHWWRVEDACSQGDVVHCYQNRILFIVVLWT